MKPPAFQFYADDFIGGTVAMSAEDVGAYIRLLCYQWGHGAIPSRQDMIDRIAGCAVSQDVLAKFPEGRNPRLEMEREKQRIYREQQSNKGKASAQARFNRGSTVVQPSGQPEVNSPSPSPSPSPISDSDSRERRFALHSQKAMSVLEALNAETGKAFRAVDSNLKLIQARLAEPGVDVVGVIQMVKRQVAKWKCDPQMCDYLRPETLFNKTKFESYYAARNEPVVQSGAGRTAPAPAALSPAARAFALAKELDKIEVQLKDLDRQSYEPSGLSQDERTKRKELRAKREELRKELNL